MDRAQTDTAPILERLDPAERLAVADPLCGEAADPVEEMVSRGFHIVRCRRCGLAWSDPHLTDQALARLVYTDGYIADQWKRPRRRPLLSRLWRALRGACVPIGHVEKRWAAARRWLPTREPLEVLEVGCWTGEFLSLSATRAPLWRVRGLEPSAFAVAHARELGLDVEQSSLEEADLPPDAFGGLIAWNVLEHTRNPVTFLFAARRVLRKGGRCVLHLPNYGGLRARLAGPRWPILLPEQHRWHFTQAALRRVLDATEAEVLHLRSFWGNVGSQTLAVVRWS